MLDEDYDTDEERPEGEVLDATYCSFIVARPTNDNKTVVIKQCRMRENRSTPRRWRNEVEILEIVAKSGHVRVQHSIHEQSHAKLHIVLTRALSYQKNVTQMLDNDPHELTITLRHEPGLSLDRHIDDEKYCTLSSTDCHAIIAQIASALTFIHSRHIVHDDVRPENIMFAIEPRPHAVLIDFGASFNQAILGRNYFILAGAPLYVPPEFLQRRKGPEADIWGLGITTLYVMRELHLPENEFYLPTLFEDWETKKEMEDWIDEVWEKVDELGERGDDGLVRRMLDRDMYSRITAEELMAASMNGA